MLEFKPLTLEDKVIFDKYLKPYPFYICDYSFTNLFIWRKGLDIQYSIYNDALIIKKTDFESRYHFLQPLGYRKEDLKNIISVLVEYKNSTNMEYLFKDVELSFINELKELYSDGFTIEEDRNNSDYIYESSRLISLAGKDLHAKRNHYNNFVKKNLYTVKEITEEIVPDCIEAAKEWCNKNDCKGFLIYEIRAIQEILRNLNKLDFVGMAVYINDKVSAFTIGEKVNDNVAIIHVEKADSDIPGLYAFINKTFVENYFSNVPFINREEDLGVEGLRKAKMSYCPYKIESKYLVM